MSLINPAILFALGLAAIPVILHFLLRSKPKKLLFPALRLIQVRKKTNVRRMRLRHVWLLLLRIGIIALLVLALARPSLPAANYALSLRESFTLAGILVAAAGVYYGAILFWRRQRLPNHVLSYRRTLLRGGTGLGVLLLFLLLVAWPYRQRVLAEIEDPRPNVAENLPVAGVFLFDTSLSMSYQLENDTRLDVAKEIATTHLANLPVQSRVAVADTSGRGDIVFQPDLVGVRDRIKALEIDPLSRGRLDDLLRSAIARQESDYQETLGTQSSLPEDERKDRFLREIYLFTDLAAGGWEQAVSKNLREELKRLSWLQIYLIDVGVTEPANVAVTDLKVSRQTVPQNGELFVEATLRATGLEDTEQIVKLNLIDASGRTVNKGQFTVTLDSGNATRVTFPVQGLNGPFDQGEVRVERSDPLAADNVRRFTVAVRPPPEVLVAADSRAEANLWMQALAPAELALQGRARYRVEYISAARLAEADLRRYEAVCLINVHEPTAAAWQKLEQYVEGGGGLAVFLGMPNREGRTKIAYDAEAARSILPAELRADLTFSPPEVLDLQDLSHPMLAKFEELGTGELTSASVRRYWRVRPFNEKYVVARYTDPRRSPALLERTHGQGRVVMLTTDVAYKGWNDLPLAWSFIALADQTTRYLCGRTAQSFNFVAGDQVKLQLDRRTRARPVLLRKPAGQVPIPAQNGGDGTTNKGNVSIVLSRDQVDQVGNYRVIGDDTEASFIGAFSVNAPAQESDFTRLTDEGLDEILGEGRYQTARDIESLNRVVTQGRIGKEVFPLVLLAMLVIFCGEHFVANRFYEAEQTPEHL